MCIIGGGWVLSSMTFTNQYGYDDIINAAHEMGHSLVFLFFNNNIHNLFYSYN